MVRFETRGRGKFVVTLKLKGVRRVATRKGSGPARTFRTKGAARKAVLKVRKKAPKARKIRIVKTRSLLTRKR